MSDNGEQTLQIAAFVDLFRMLSARQATGMLTVESRLDTARIYLKQGRVVHAATELIQGEAAVLSVLTWSKGEAEWMEDEEPEVQTMDVSVQELFDRLSEMGLHYLPPEETASLKPAGWSLDSPLYTLVVAAPEQEPYRVEIRKKVIVLGRGLESDVVLAHRSVSKKHAKLEWMGPGFRITDLGSSNGTYVNGQQISEGEFSCDHAIYVGHVCLALKPGGGETFAQLT